MRPWTAYKKKSNVLLGYLPSLYNLQLGVNKYRVMWQPLEKIMQSHVEKFCFHLIYMYI